LKKTLPQLTPYDIECLNKCRQIIDTDLSVRYTVARLASIAGMSTTKFKTAFKEIIGYNVFEYAQMQRMNHAYKLVTENYHAIKTIAMLCGYLHASHFYTAFKKTFGISARKMRLQLNHSNARVILKKTNRV
jgi:AraC-like DNA-binding protein